MIRQSSNSQIAAAAPKYRRAFGIAALIYLVIGIVGAVRTLTIRPVGVPIVVIALVWLYIASRRIELTADTFTYRTLLYRKMVVPRNDIETASYVFGHLPSGTGWRSWYASQPLLRVELGIRGRQNLMVFNVSLFDEPTINGIVEAMNSY
jgi:hypothetical protein